MTPCPKSDTIRGMESSAKRIVLRCKLLSPFLGDQRSAGGIRKLDITHQKDADYFLPSNAQWRWALREAMDAIGILAESNVDYIRIPSRILSPKINLYTRVLDRQKPDKRDMFECYQAGTVISFPVFILGSLETEGYRLQLPDRPPTEEEVKKCFDIIGESIGLSPWGSKFGYGRFLLLDN